MIYLDRLNFELMYSNFLVEVLNQSIRKCGINMIFLKKNYPCHVDLVRFKVREHQKVNVHNTDKQN